jgi:hypothetical protein
MSLAEAFKMPVRKDSVTHLGENGVLRSLNAARDTVVDYVQFKERLIEEYLAR